MYIKSAKFYDQLYHFKDYALASDNLRESILSLKPDAKTLLDIACSTGQHLQYLQKYFDAKGLDINPDLIAIARERCPSVEFHVGDMMDFDLGRKFDVVTCLFSSIAYAKTVDNLNSAIVSMARHLVDGGLLFVEPWVSPEKYWDNNIVMNIAESPEQKIAWMYVGKRDGTLVTNDINYMVGTPDGVFHFTETHYMGLFTYQDYINAISNAGLTFVRYDPKGFFGNGLYVAERHR